MRRLDLECAQAASDLSAAFQKTDEKLIADAAAVLAGQGLYAFAVFLRAKAKKEKAGQRKAGALLLRCSKLIAALKQKNAPEPSTDDAAVALAKDVAADLQKLLLAKKITAETLTYLKYHIKAKDDPKNIEAGPESAAPKATEQERKAATA